MVEFEIIEENYQNEEKNNYLIIYKIENLKKLDISEIYIYYNNINIIPCSKIYFELDADRPIIYTQKSIKDKNINNYIIHYKHKIKEKIKEIKENIELYPGLLIKVVQ